jgi:hypothetical protein
MSPESPILSLCILLLVILLLIQQDNRDPNE